MRERVRDLMYTRHIGDWYQWETEGSPYSHPEYRVVTGSLETTRDETHGKDWRKRGGDSGGPFNARKTIVTRWGESSSTIYRVNGIGNNRGKYYSGILTAKEEPDPPALDALSIANDAGATLWNQARPGKPIFNTLNAAYELREVPNMLKTRYKDLFKQKGLIRGSSNVYLEYMFGWAPLLQDTRDFVISHFALKKALDQLLRDEGRPIRRKAGFPPKFIDHGDYHGDQYDAFEQHLVTQAYHSVPHLRVNWSEEESVWLSARFRYSLPPGPKDWLWTARIIAKLYGLNPNPHVIYKAIPWSWLVDWFSNVGDVIANASGGVEDKLSADYAYVMCRKAYWRRSWASGEFYTANDLDSWRTIKARTEKYTSHKVRVPATPFGFAIKHNELSLTQNSILWALGLSKAKGSWF